MVKMALFTSEVYGIPSIYLAVNLRLISPSHRVI